MAEGHDYQPGHIDCFFFQYQTDCEEGQDCQFLHRESCKSSGYICPVWHAKNGCTNDACPKKHLNQEILKQYFLCDQENSDDYCTRNNCRMYHEKVSYFNGFYRSASEVPMLAEERRIEHGNFVLNNFPQTQISLKSASQFILTAAKFIQLAVRSRKLPGDRGKQYMREILHTILFLCHINNPAFEPQELLEESMDSWNLKFPDVFEQYKTHLPTRPPYTILLEIVVDYKGSDNPKRILDCLSKLNSTIFVEHNTQQGSRCGNELCVIATVISHCFFQDLERGTTTNNYFGASVSCFGKHQKEIMIDILCYHTWNEYISVAVCMALQGHPQAIMLRPVVHSIAYSRGNPTGQRGVHTVNGKPQQYTPIPPCRKCLTLFPDIVIDQQQIKIGIDPQQRKNAHRYWPYGNCAEVESFNRLLSAHGDISRGFAVPLGDKFTWESLKRKRKGRLVHNLKLCKFQLGNNLLFYRPSEPQNTA
ncbi:uncharacterized protein LOC119953580 [Scyliorhinus canicula]|uniref:uncharacterized protein LOC119953580 n=1 Tax=Scyliorhinus canicula TaxID=7830 RepID=UPI0018F732FB|nr:uncharacterized protein LOC119953580 [Scyliorhinus canicula]